MMNEELDPRFGARPQQSGIYKILFVEKLPKIVKSDSLNEIFAQFHGFVEVRHIQEKGVAFVEFMTDDLAAQALQTVSEQNMLVFQADDQGDEMVQARITYGKK